MPRVLNSNPVVIHGVLVLVFLTSSLALAQSPPNVSLSAPGTVKEMGIQNASVSASDPDGDPLTINWSFDSDPSGQAYYFSAATAAYTKTR